MRLADFITENIEPILTEWEAFARQIWPGAATDAHELRDHAGDILRATAHDMQSSQTAAEQAEKSKGEGEDGGRIDRASDVHAVGRVRSGFDMMAVVAEYCALRASVVRLWRESGCDPNKQDLEDLTRFNESIDQSLAEAVRSYTAEVDRSRQMFLAILGHDLRNPLNSVMMSAHILERSAKLDADSKKTASQIAKSVTAMAGMIRDLLDFTNAGLGSAIPLVPLSVDLNAICSEVVGELRAAHPERDVRFAPDGALKGEWDAARLRQVISNLIGNALQHGSNTAPITLQSGTESAGGWVSVHNEGRAIPKELLPTIFDPLVRAAVPNEQRRPGSIGLGLHIAREVVAAHGGRIAVESSDDAGTIFTVHLPLKTTRPPAPVPV